MRRPEAGILVLALLASACAIPTEMPNWDTTWDLPLPDNGGMNIPVSSFIPSGVTTVGTPATAFQATVGSPSPISRTLGADCTACVPLNNTTAIKPAFTSAPPATSVTLAAASSLTSGVLAAGSQVVFSINNGFNFDPIRPDSGALTNTGTMTLTVTNGTATLGTVTLLGSATGITRSAITTITMPLAGTISGASPISVTMTMSSPQSTKKVPIVTSQVLSISAVPTLLVSTATVSIGAQAVSAPPTPIDLSQLDSAFIRRVADSATTQGALYLTVNNPFAVGAAATITFTGTKQSQSGPVAITPVVKTVTIPAAATSSTVSVSLTGVELRQLLGSNLVVTFSGTTAAGSLTVTPTAKITMTSRMQITLYAREIP